MRGLGTVADRSMTAPHSKVTQRNAPCIAQASSCLPNLGCAKALPIEKALLYSKVQLLGEGILSGWDTVLPIHHRHHGSVALLWGDTVRKPPDILFLILGLRSTR